MPAIVANIKRADGSWKITHSWEVVQAASIAKSGGIFQEHQA